VFTFPIATYTGAPPFISTWKTDNAGSSTNHQITVPTVATGTYNCTVNWGDGNVSTLITTYNDAQWTHTYASIGTYTVYISGVFNGISFNNTGDKAKILNISNWGTGFNLGNEGNNFYDCTNLTITATDSPSLIGVTTLTHAFRECFLLTTVPGINSWNTSNISIMALMFANCTLWDEDISQLSIAALTDATNMLVSSAFSTTNYNKLLDSVTGWPSQVTIKHNVIFNAGSAHYNSANAIAGRAMLTGTYGWTITDGGTP